VVTRSIGPCDRSSQERNQAHVNQTIDMSGAVLPLASALPDRTESKPNSFEIPVLSMQARNQRRRIALRCIFIAEVARFARLCVLIEPNPARHSIRLDLAGFCILSGALRIRVCRKYLQILLLWSGKPRRSSRGWYLAILPPDQWDRSTLVYKPAHAYVHYHAQREEGKQHRGSAVTH
jgi:hypothetical protein